MSITLRLTKGTALTFTELDANFSDLDGRVTTNTTNISTLNSSVSSINSTVSTNTGSISTNASNIAAIDTRLITAEAELDSLGGIGILKTVTADAGSTITASNHTGTFNIAGGDGISTTASGTTVTINAAAPTVNFTVGINDSSNKFFFASDDRFFRESSENPTLVLRRGEQYIFNLSLPSEPFYIKTSPTTGTGQQYTTGVSGNGTQFGILTFTPIMTDSATLYYQSSVTSTMGGKIELT